MFISVIRSYWKFVQNKDSADDTKMTDLQARGKLGKLQN